MLSKEEKKAIEMMEIIVDECKSENRREGYEGTYYDGDTPIPYKEYEIILNLIKKLQKENKELKQENKRIKYFSSNLFIDDYIPKKVIKDKLQENKAKTYCKNCDNTCDSYQLCKFLEELLGDE